MSVPFHLSVSLDAIKNQDSNRTFITSGGIADADVGKAVTLDITQANTVKLAGIGDPIIGRLETWESRGDGAVQLHFTDRLPIKTGATVLVGDTVEGGGGGTVQSAASKNYSNNYVVEVLASGYAIVVKM